VTTRFARLKARFGRLRGIRKTIFSQSKNEVYPVETTLENEVYRESLALRAKPSVEPYNVHGQQQIQANFKDHVR
jgi:hypothetical protein